MNFRRKEGGGVSNILRRGRVGIKNVKIIEGGV